MLRLVTGRASSGKTARLHSAISQAVAEGGSAALLVPSSADAGHARYELADDAPVGVAVSTMDAWIDAQWGLGGDGRRIVGAIARRELLRSVVAEDPPPALRPLGQSRGLLRVIEELAARSCGDPALVRTGAAEAAIAEILSAYRQELVKRGLIERAEAAATLSVASAPVPNVIAVDRFSDLAAYQERLVLKLAAFADVWLTLPWEPEFPATEGLTPLVNRLAAAATKHHGLVRSAAAGGSAELRALEAGLYRPETGRIQPSGAVCFAGASGNEAEIELAVDAVADLLGEGFAPEQVALVFRSLGGRAHRLATALEVREIPADVDVAMRFGRTPFGRAMLQILRACLGHEGRTGLAAFLASPFSGSECSASRRVDATWRRFRVQERRRLLEDAAGCGQATRRSIRAAEAASRGGASKGRLSDWKELADTLLSSGLREPDRSRFDVRLDAAAHRAALQVVHEASVAPGPVDIEALISALEDATVVTGGGGGGRSAVQVTEVRRLRGRRFDAVVVGGLTAGEFSSDHAEALHEKLSRRLGMGSDLPPRHAERLAFYLLATRARRRLVLLRMVCDSRGEPLRPSVFWEEVADLYREPLSDDAEAVPDDLPSIELNLADIARSAPAFSNGRDALRAAAVAADDRPAADRKGLTIASEGQLTETDEFSVTELEAYLSCPYRWFYDRVLAPRELDRSVDARERGSRAHRILARFYESLSAEGHERVRPENLEIALALVDAAARQVESEAHVRPADLKERTWVAQSLAWARGIVVDDASFLPGFVPVAHELVFGEGSGQVLEIAGVRLRGSIDRVDASDDVIAVTDYKSGSSLDGRTGILKTAKLQLPLYALAAEGILGRSVVGAFYRSLKTREVRGFWLAGHAAPPERCAHADQVDESGLLEMTAWAETLVTEATAGIRAGDIAPRPRDANACHYCGAADFCTEARR